MKWRKFTIQTTCEAVDLVSSMLDDLGIEGIEIEDNVPLTEQETKGMFIDILPELPLPFEKDAEILVYCRSGRRSAEAAEKLTGMGYANVSDFGGIQDWPYETTTD